MDSDPISSPSKRFEVPKPETGLAEWTSKIKAMQRQVDADEEAEQKRLEDEIAAARQARLRRSRGMRNESLDLSNQRIIDSKNDKPSSIRNINVERHWDQDTTQHKLHGDTDESSERVTQSFRATPIALSHSSSTSVSTSQRPEPVSLAAFIGGRATGPRLNRHAPQQDAHDPIQFDQPDISVPHPVFGHGGVAMPGLAKKIGSPSAQDRDTDIIERYQPTSYVRNPSTITENKRAEWKSEKKSVPITAVSPTDERARSISPLPQLEERERTTSAGSAQQREKEDTKEISVSPKITGSRGHTTSTGGWAASDSHEEEDSTTERPTSLQKAAFRDRTTSSSVIATLGGRFGETQAQNQSSNKPSNEPSRPFPRSSVPDTRTSSSVRERHISTPSFPATARSATTTAASMSTERPTTSRQRNATATSTSFQNTQLITTPSLGRPIAPDPRISANSPVVPSSFIASPAFQKPATPKDPTPSISRLQGRGFVQNMVRASSQLEGSSSPSSYIPSSSSSPRSGGKTGSVLDRWQSNLGVGVSPPSTAQRATGPVRRSVTMDPATLDSETTTGAPLKTLTAELMSVASLPSPSRSPSAVKYSSPNPEGDLQQYSKGKLPERIHFENTPDPQLGSATTMVLYKPINTSNGSTEFSVVDEMGVKRYDNKASDTAPGENVLKPAAPTSKPLVHPTKDRARKPKKNRDVSGISDSLKPETKVADANTSIQHLQPISQSDAQHRRVSFLDERSSPQASPSIDTAPISKVARLSERWANTAPIGIKSTASARQTVEELRPPSMVRHALPGMTSSSYKDGSTTSTQEPRSATFPLFLEVTKPNKSSAASDTRQSNDKQVPEQLVIAPSSPSKQTRIPSTGNRATVMDVAEALQTQTRLGLLDTSVMQDSPLSSPKLPKEPSRLRNASSNSTERRKSSYEKYSAIAMPPLREEVTPMTTPIGTLFPSKGFSISKKASNTQDSTSSRLDDSREKENVPIISTETLSRSSVAGESPASEQLSETKTSTNKSSDMIHLDHEDIPLPKIDMASFIKSRSSSPALSSDLQTVSVDVMAITGTTATSLSQNTDIFYDSEVLVVIRRSKSKSSGLVSTVVWVWKGTKSRFGEREERKTQELAKRYGTLPIILEQFAEPAQLVHVLGGQLIIRQGSRAHWTSENTAMYLIRSLDGVMYIDEHDLNIKNLCSAFSYCITVLGAVYVWHGCGSTPLERQSALWYAQSLLNESNPLVELSEGVDDNDEMFWMILGDEQFARADYWKWRKTSSVTDPRIWRLNASSEAEAIVPVVSFLYEKDMQESVYIVDCVWELFVIVGREARGHRQDIRLALDIAIQLSGKASSVRPYPPTVHVLVLPSQLPLDLRLNVRGCDESLLNNSEVPDHMNLVSSSDALDHLRKRSWEKTALRDVTMLPLGVDVSDTTGL